MSTKIRVRQKRSTAGQLRNIISSVRGLGLRRIGHTVEVLDTPQNRGMINAANHLVEVVKS
jgi:large subunit ribosomal protein L30